MSVGKLQPFDLSKDNWTLYIERLEQYFIVNDVKTEKKVPTLITLIGSDTYELMVNLCTPERPAKKSFDDLVNLISGYLQPKPSELAERFKFRHCVQKTGSSISDYVTELKKLSINCGFQGDALKENIRDQFVCGLGSDGIRQRLFAEEKLTFDTAYKLAVTMEAAESDASLVEDWSRRGDSKGTMDTSVHATSVSKRERVGAPRHSAAGSERGRAGPSERWVDFELSSTPGTVTLTSQVAPSAAPAEGHSQPSTSRPEQDCAHTGRAPSQAASNSSVLPAGYSKRVRKPVDRFVCS